jgi:hypothetical protein
MNGTCVDWLIIGDVVRKWAGRFISLGWWRARRQDRRRLPASVADSLRGDFELFSEERNGRLRHAVEEKALTAFRSMLALVGIH